jgi:hypothetical protein
MGKIIIIISLLLFTKGIAPAQHFFADAWGGFVNAQYISIKDNDRKISDESFGLYPIISAKGGISFRHSIFKIYVSLKFDGRGFETYVPYSFAKQIGQLEYPDNNYLVVTKIPIEHTLWRFLPGFGIRLIPFNEGSKNHRSSPIFQVGVDFDYFQKYKGFFDKKKGQLEKGINTVLGLGWRFDDDWSLICELETQDHNMFNSDFTLDNGYFYPFKNMTSKMYCLTFSISWEFLD